jgi:signal-transduction protein with cAMP-binding, CBS, and nucleotidyltransferase domain
MRISEFMHTPVVTCPTTTTLGEVARVMGDRNVGSVLVLDRTGHLAGIVTDRDLTVRGLGEGRSADSAVEDVMTRAVATVSVHSDVADAAAIMSRRSIRRLPVVDEDGKAHGIVTLDDLIRQLGMTADALADTIFVQQAKFVST